MLFFSNIYMKVKRCYNFKHGDKMKAVKRSFIKKISKYWEIVKKFIIKNKIIFLLALPFILIDLITRIAGHNLDFFAAYRLVPNLFTIIWIVLFLGISLSFKDKIGKIIYSFFAFFSLVMFLLQNVYFSMTKNYFSFTLLESASEGKGYILDTMLDCNKLVYLFFVIILGLFIYCLKKYPKNKKFNKKVLINALVCFLILHLITPLFLGRADENLVWSTWKNPRNVYNLYNDSNKSMRVSGIYEYTFRNLYVTFLRKEKTDEEELKELKEIYSKEVTKSKNSYTNKYKDKNVIFLQLEGVDTWLLNKKDTPTLYSMLNNSINFKNHYSFYTGGGSTFNSEFAVNTGFIVPLSYNKNSYSFNKNSFPYSMPHLFKQQGYLVNAFHMNSGEFYSRTINYKNWGYDNYYGLIDMYKFDDISYELDRALFANPEYVDLMFPKDAKFVDYIISYSTHMPFTNNKGVCKMLYNIDNEGKEVEFKEMSEEECARRQTRETDYMIELMLQELKSRGLYDNTVIVVFTDHYLYTIEDKNILSKYKNTKNNLINKTPFFIWSSKGGKKDINQVTSQLNILPTVFNLMGIDYNPNYYIGVDALQKNYSGIVFFSDYSWYDGNVYVVDGEVQNNKKISKGSLISKNEKINELARKNDLTLKYNYFKKSK